eukprot:227403_1
MAAHFDDQHPLYAQKSKTAQYGIKPSQQDPEHPQTSHKPEWTIAERKSQDLARQIPKSSKPDANALNEDYTTKLVHEWNVNDAGEWLNATLNQNDIDDTVISKYVLFFKQENINGTYLITKIDSHQYLLDLCTEHAPINTIQTKDITQIIFNTITKLKKRAKREINRLHPMKQSNLDELLKDQFITKDETVPFIHENNEIETPSSDASFCSRLMQITENRQDRISLLSLILLMFCLISSIDFIPNNDYGGIFAMVMFVVGTCIIMCLLCREGHADYAPKYIDLKGRQQKKHGNIDTDNLLRDAGGDQEDKVRDMNEYTLSVGGFHILAIICVLFGGMAFVVSRWMKMGAISMDEWLYGFGIGFYIGGLCLILVVDLAFIKLLDKHSRRMKCYHLMNFMYYLLVIGYFAVKIKFVFLGIIAITAAFISLVVMIVFSFPRLLEMFAQSLIKVVLPTWIVLIHIVTMICLLGAYDMKFYPVVDDASVYGSIAFIILSSTVAVILAIDSRISLKTPWYKANF